MISDHAIRIVSCKPDFIAANICHPHTRLFIGLASFVSFVCEIDAMEPCVPFEPDDLFVRNEHIFRLQPTVRQKVAFLVPSMKSFNYSQTQIVHT